MMQGIKGRRWFNFVLTMGAITLMAYFNRPQRFPDDLRLGDL